MKIRNLGWVIAGLLFIATGLSFLDRQVLSMLILKIQPEIKITEVEYGWINTFFLISYAIMFTLGGLFIDRFGTRIGLAVSVGIWSLSTAFHSLAQNIWHLGIARFFLGAGEGGCFPGAAKGVTEWFPHKNKALAMGIAIGGASFGAVIAPPVTVWLNNHTGWRGTFLAIGIFGLLWVATWMIFFNKPGKSRLITAGELADIEKEHPQVREESKTSIPLGIILKTKEAWGLIMIRFMLDPVFYFIMFWIPKYLSQERNVSFERIGKLFWIPFFALGISNIFGGWFSDRLIRSGVSVNAARKSVMGIAAALTMAAPLTTVVSDEVSAIMIISLIMFAHGFWITNYITTTGELFGRYTSTVVGLSGSAGAISGLILNPVIGKVIEAYSYAPVWVLAGLMYPAGFIILLLTIRNIQPVSLNHTH
jgi:ACS family hexuronate transporter-like MFS transporter